MPKRSDSLDAYIDAAAAALNKVSPHHAELFSATRLAAPHASMYGAVDLDPSDVRALLERALP